MATMISEVYDALKEAGASEEKARQAAEAIAGYETRFGRIENDLTLLKGDVALLKWMVGFNLAMTSAVLWKVFAA
jgi:hypothetical protein